jgi:hypothetical protein
MGRFVFIKGMRTLNTSGPSSMITFAITHQLVLLDDTRYPNCVEGSEEDLGCKLLETET